MAQEMADLGGSVDPGVALYAIGRVLVALGEGRPVVVDGETISSLARTRAVEGQPRKASAASEYLSVPEAAHHLQMSESKIWQLLDREIPATRPPGTRRTFIARVDLDSFMARGRTAPPPLKLVSSPRRR